MAVYIFNFNFSFLSFFKDFSMNATKADSALHTQIWHYLNRPLKAFYAASTKCIGFLRSRDVNPNKRSTGVSPL